MNRPLVGEHHASTGGPGEGSSPASGEESWRQLPGDWDGLRSAWAALDVGVRARRLADLERRLFELEARGASAAGGMDPPAHARGV
ncbi:MAG: hypothetical protein ACPGPE_11240, partial [Planctomycetota bacterium]